MNFEEVQSWLWLVPEALSWSGDAVGPISQQLWEAGLRQWILDVGESLQDSVVADLVMKWSIEEWEPLSPESL